MPTIDWPEALIPQSAQLTLRKAGAQFASPFNGTTQAVDFLAERWTLSASLAQMSARNPRGVDAFCNTLAGGVERVRVWPFHQPQPRGSLRWQPVVGSLAAARGDQLLVLSSALGANLLLGGSFEFDSNADGLADGWLPIQTGSVSSVVRSLQTAVPMDGSNEQGVDCVFGAPGATVGIERFVPLLPGPGTYTVRAQVRGGGEAQQFRILVEPRDVNSVIIPPGITVVQDGLPGSPQVVGGTFVAPPGSVACTIRLEMVALNSGTPANIRWDGVALVGGSPGLAWPGRATLRQGDYLGAGGQLFMCAADCQANDAGGLSVPVVNRVRAPIAAGSPVTWYRPTCEMMLPAMQAGPVRRAGAIESTALDFVEVW
jgi:hypothetical protein